jgi:hypothetical protein
MSSEDMGRVAQESLRGQEPTNKWAVMIIVAIGVFIQCRTQYSVFELDILA